MIPTICHEPAKAMCELTDLVDQNRQWELVLMGSSLGGFYATYLAEKFSAPAVLINPAVRPYEYWRTHLGKHQNYYSGETHIITPEHIEELAKLEIESLSRPENYQVYLQTGDETLDYQRAVKKYSTKHCVIHEGGSHSYDNFDRELPAMLAFLLSRIDAAER